MPSDTSSTPRWQYTSAYLLGALFFLYAFVQRVSPSVMTAELMRDFSAGAAGIGLLSGAYLYTYALMQLPVGVLIDRFGPRKLMSGAALICAVASIGFAFSNHFLFAFVNRAIIGGAVAFSFVGTLSVASTFFKPSGFSILTGLLIATGMVGAITGQAPLKLLVDQVGWRFTLELLAAIALVLAVLLYYIVPKRSTQLKQALEQKKTSSMLTGLTVVVRNPQSWFSAGAGFGLTTTMLSFSGLWAVPWMVSTKGMQVTEAAAVSSTLFFGMMLGAPLMGWLTGVIGRRKPILISGSLLCLVTIVFIVYTDNQSIELLTGLFFCAGMGAGAMVASFGICREWNQPRYNATSLGLVNMCVVGSGAIMQPVIGALLDYHWDGKLIDGARVYSANNFNFALATLVVSSLIALLCSILVKETYCKQQVHDDA